MNLAEPFMLDFKCQKCGKCCRHYYIIVTPEEAEKQAKFLNLPEKDFLGQNTQLFLQLFPTTFKERECVINSNLIPKKLFEKIDLIQGVSPNFFLAMPMLALRRKENGACEFYEKEKGCLIYPERPMECRLFPFVSDKVFPDYSKEYPFCHGIGEKDGALSYFPAEYLHAKKVDEYMSLIEKNGFKKTWKHFPKNGVLLLENKLLGEISAEDFFETMGPLA